MMQQFNTEKFIKENILYRDRSFFLNDIKKNKKKLKKNIIHKTVLIIGGAGTIGKSFIKELLNFSPKKVVVVDINENELTELTRDLRSNNNFIVPEIFLTYPVDFGSEIFFKIFEHHGPFNIVANFAAHKHVRSEKDIFSIESMFQTNLFKAKNLMDLLKKNKPEHFFCVSTDKATNPVNLMGLSKKMMENLIMSYSKDFKVTTARFANVAFSNGSLLDGLKKRLERRQPISCPSNIKRFFVSSEESGQICLLSCICGSTGDIFFPKMTNKNLISFKKIIKSFFKEIKLDIIVFKKEDQAKYFFDNNEYSNKYPIYFFKSNTTGEKLSEEFFSEKDDIDFKKYNSLGVIKSNSYDLVSISKMLKTLKIYFKKKQEKKDIVDFLSKKITDFHHAEKGKNLDEQM